MPEEGRELDALGRRHLFEHGKPALLVELHQQVRGVIALHPREHGRHFLVRPAAQKLDLVLVVELLEDVGLELLVL